MSILVDTPIWSLALRRRQVDLGSRQAQLVTEWVQLVREGRARLLGIVRQEVLSGIRDELQFRRLLRTLRGFSDALVIREDHEEAAVCYNRCRAHGIQGSSADYLICAVAIRLGAPIFTTDADFSAYARHLPITLYQARQTHA